MRQNRIIIEKYIIVFLLFLLFLTANTSCKKEKTAIKDLGIKLDSSYVMATENVKVYISDSGLIQYKMRAKEWYIYDNADRAYWYFPKKFYIEKFDSLRRTTAYVKSDTAYYYTNIDKWELVGHVIVKNMKGEQFFSPRLFWDKREGRVYSDDTILIKKSDGLMLRGNKFWANQDMSRYEIYNNSGSFMIAEKSENNSTSDSESNAGNPTLSPMQTHLQSQTSISNSSSSLFPPAKKIKP